MGLRQAGGLFAMLWLAGCASVSGGNSSSPHLSDAARQASGEHLTVSSPPHASRNQSLQPGPLHLNNGTVDLELQMAGPPLQTSSWAFGFEYARIHYTSGPLKDGQFYALYTESLDSQHTSAYGYRLVYGSYVLPTSGVPGDAFDDVTSWGIDTYFKQYFRDFSLFSAPYVLVSLGYGALQWDYLQPITDSSGYTFTSDSLDYVEVRFGAGGELGSYQGLQLSLYAGPVGRFYQGQTREGFNNDLFHDRVDVSWGANLGIRF